MQIKRSVVKFFLLVDCVRYLIIGTQRTPLLPKRAQKKTNLRWIWLSTFAWTLAIIHRDIFISPRTYVEIPMTQMSLDMCKMELCSLCCALADRSAAVVGQLRHVLILEGSHYGNGSMLKVRFLAVMDIFNY